MENGKHDKLKNNVGLIEALLRLMFETFWTAPYDRRRSDPLLGDFCRTAQQLARLLVATDLKTAPPDRLSEVRLSAEQLCQDVRRVAGAGIFTPVRCAAALKITTRIYDAVCEACAVD